MPLLEVRDLAKQFGRTTAVDGLTFSVRGGEVVGLLGPNGAGKSTTFLCACGLLRPDRGAFFWDDALLGPERGRTVGLIPETPEVYPMLTVWEHMVFVAKSCKLKADWEARADDLLQRFVMNEQRNTLGQSLSKGMKQKLLIAATLLAETPIVLFDEPMIGLDPLGQRELRDIIVSLRERGTAIVISTHMVEQAQVMCDRAVILKNGRKIADGTFVELQSASATPGTAEDVFLELTR